MKIDGRQVTPNELAKIELLQLLGEHMTFGDSQRAQDTIDGTMTEREAQELGLQEQKRYQSIRNLLGADKLAEKFKINV